MLALHFHWLSIVATAVVLGGSGYLTWRLSYKRGKTLGHLLEEKIWRKKEITGALGGDDVEVKVTDWVFIDDGATIIGISPENKRYLVILKEKNTSFPDEEVYRIDTISSYRNIDFAAAYVSKRVGSYVFAQYRAWCVQQNRKTKKKNT